MKRIGCFFLCICLYLSIQHTYANEVPEVVSEFVYIYNQDNQEVIYEKNAQAKLYPASMTKIMTTLVVLEQIEDLHSMITITPEALTGLAEQYASVAGFVIGEEVSVEDLLYGVMLPSGADATRALALEISGSEEGFVQLMNEKANSLQLVNTNFMNTSGLHHDNHYSTAQEISVILQEALKNETFKTIFSTNQYTTKPTNIHPAGLRLMSTKFKPLFQMDFEFGTMLRGGKTGFTLEGGLCLASIVEINNASYIVVTANAGQNVQSSQHLRDTYTLSKYLQEKYSLEEVFKKDDLVATANVILGKANGVQAYVKEDVAVFRLKQDAFRYEIELDTRVAPVVADEEIGTLTLYLESEVHKVIPLYAQTSVERSMFFTVLLGMGCILLIGTLVIGGRVLQVRRRERKR